MTPAEKKLAAAKRYLKSRGIAATALDSKLRYTNAAGQETPPPEWIRKDEKPVIVLADERRKA